MKIKDVINKTFLKLGYTITKTTNLTPDIDRDKVFCKIYKKCKPYTMTSKERMYALYSATKYIIKNNVKGDFVECGCWKGGSMMLVAETLKYLRVSNRKLWLYDTFEGMPKPTGNDTFLNGQNPVWNKWFEYRQKGTEWCYVTLHEVKRNMKRSKYPMRNIRIIKGMVEDTLSNKKSKKIALLRLDTDLYKSTKHELKVLYPLLVKNGIMILDDYGHFSGAKKAVDEYKKKDNILMNRIDYTGRLIIKQ